ncbi:hypothetical protein ACFVY9_02815 [Streptomyces sp. NPDC059544]|uniref:hypothetical protein n=1 Tax=Streptomyces sp. NPDC059544 TaxID=3346861 RepID=UPI0036CA1334
MSAPNPAVARAARIIAAAIVHGTGSDPALDAAQALADERLLAPADPFAVPGRNRPERSPAAVAALAECRRAKNVADSARLIVDRLPGDATVEAAGGEVSFVVHPQSLTAWKEWLHMFGVGDARGDSTGATMIVRCTYGGVRARIVGVGVPAMYGAMHERTGRRTAVRP